MKKFIENLFFMQIWYYYRQHLLPLSLSFLLGLGAVIFSTQGSNLLSIVLIIFSTVLFLNSYLKITKVYGLFWGLFIYMSIMSIAIYCFSNIYIEIGIINEGKLSKEIWDAIYFSVVTWTTLGYGDFKPSEGARIWAAGEAMLGYIYMGLLVALLISGLTPDKSRFSEKTQAKKNK